VIRGHWDAFSVANRLPETLDGKKESGGNGPQMVGKNGRERK
jgi:hypothetical protein